MNHEWHEGDKPPVKKLLMIEERIEELEERVLKLEQYRDNIASHPHQHLEHMRF